MRWFCTETRDTRSIYEGLNPRFDTGHLNIKVNLLAGRIPCCTTTGVRMMVLPSGACCSGVRITVIPGRSGVPCTTCTKRESTCELGKKLLGYALKLFGLFSCGSKQIQCLLICAHTANTYCAFNYSFFQLERVGMKEP